MYCLNCGQKLNVDAKFCSKCGTEVQHGTVNNPQDQKQSPIICPKCHRDDKIEKVTSIVKSQTRTREETEWVTQYYTDKGGREQSYSYPRSYNIVEITDLAKRLFPPQKPQTRSFSSCILILGIMWCIFGLGFFLKIVPTIERGDIWNTTGGLSDLVLVILGMGGVPSILAMLIFMAKIRHDKNERNRVGAEMALWEDAIKIWNRLYYCYRDDIVFDSNNIKDTCQPEDIIRFCYQTEKSDVSRPLTKEEFTKLTYRQQFAVKEFGYLLSPEDAERVGEMVGNFRDGEARRFSRERGSIVTYSK